MKSVFFGKDGQMFRINFFCLGGGFSLSVPFLAFLGGFCSYDDDDPAPPPSPSPPLKTFFGIGVTIRPPQEVFWSLCCRTFLKA